MRQETGCAPFALSTSGWELEKMRMAARPLRDVMGGGGCVSCQTASGADLMQHAVPANVLGKTTPELRPLADRSWRLTQHGGDRTLPRLSFFRSIFLWRRDFNFTFNKKEKINLKLL